MKQRCLLAIWLDAFRIDYLTKPTTPFIYQLSKEALRGECETLLAFEGIGASILTGVSPLKHGVWTQFCFNPVSSPFKWTKGASIINRFVDALADETGVIGRVGRAALNLSVLQLSRRIAGRTSLRVPPMIPIQNLQFFDITLRTSIYKNHALAVSTIFDVLRKHDIPFKVVDGLRDAEAFKRGLHLNREARLVFIHFVNIDIVGHWVGPYAGGIRKWLLEVDRRVMRIVEEHRKTSDTDVFIFSDHGMAEVGELVDVLKHLRRTGLKEVRDFVPFLDSTIARIWVSTPKAENQIRASLIGLKGGRLLSEPDFKHYQIPADRKYGDIIWLADPGNLILPNYYQGSNPVRGMHGYAPETEGLRTPFIIRSKAVDPRRICNTATPMDIFPTMAELLDIPVPPTVEGRSLISRD